MQQTTKKISIIIVNYNSKDFLLQCVKSIEKASENLNVEIIVVDNNSSDGSIGYLTPLLPHVNFIALNENLGFAKANNIGSKECSGDYFLILNPDTLIEENTLTTMLDFMEEHAEVGGAGCKVLNADGTFQVACRRGFPTPWASFSKLFGLQSLFPKSKLFAQYNQTYLSVDETYYIDSIIGAFMFIRKQAWDDVKGFDETFFMYGEDIDLCYRLNQTNWKISYVHTTSVIHYKGISTKRSSINELEHFYDAMKIFSSKHYSSSSLFFTFIKSGIKVREWIARIINYKTTLLVLILDILAMNFALLLATKIRFGGYFNFPEYAYPTVFIVLSIILITSMVSMGEYFENRPSFRKALSGLLITLFILSSLTYFFKDYAFSRGVVLMTIGFTIISTYISRSILSIIYNYSITNANRKLAIVGTGKEAVEIYNAIRNSDQVLSDIVGFISTSGTLEDELIKENLIGNLDYINNVVLENNIKEIIIAEKSINSNELMKLIQNTSNLGVKYHVAFEWDDIVASRIIDDISGYEPTIPDYNLAKFRFRFIKRTSDIIISLFSLTIGLPIVYLLFRNSNKLINRLFDVLKGKLSIVGLYPVADNVLCRTGLTGMVHISKPEKLTIQAINRLNDYYLMNYTFSLDIEIILKKLFRK